MEKLEIFRGRYQKKREREKDELVFFAAAEGNDE